MTDAVQNIAPPEPVEGQHATRETWEYYGNIHMHTVHSDGAGKVGDLIAAANKVGLDFIIVTDHNTLVDQNEEGWRDGVLTLLDSEIHDVDLVPERNHCLTLDVHEDLSSYAASPQGLIDAVRERGGMTFLAHPVDYPSSAVPVSFEWTAWDIEGFTGMELWNFMSEFRPPATGPAVFLHRPLSRISGKVGWIFTATPHARHRRLRCTCPDVQTRSCPQAVFAL